MALAGLAGAGNNPWTSKPYQQWDDKDIAKILKDSPWTRTVLVEQTWKPLNPADVESDDAASPGHAAAPGSGGVNAQRAPQASTQPMPVLPAENDDDAPARGADTPFLVYWASSRTLREALARRAVLHAGNDPKQADEYVNAPQEEYQVLVQGKDMAPFQRRDEKAYASMSWLQVKPSKDKIAPSHVTYTRDAANVVNGAIFFFAKTRADGSPLFTAQSKTADFSCKVGASTIHASFDFAKMQDQKGQDL
jgi:hypothetical protein